MSASETPIKWRWWYPEGCIQHPGFEEHTLRAWWTVSADDGDGIAAEIVDAYVSENGTDGSNSFEIEIAEPAVIAGVYDVRLEWEPVAVASKRKVAKAAQHEGSD